MNKISIVQTLALVLLIVSCKSKKANEQTSVQPLDTVKVFVLKKEHISKTISLPAELIPWERSELNAKVTGYVREINVDIGDRVKKNEVLVVLDAPEINSNYAKSSAELLMAEAKYRSSLDNFNRIRQAAGEKGVISGSEMEKATNQLYSDSSALNAAKSGTNAYAQLRNYLTIRAPFEGVITQRQGDAGALLSTGSKPILVIENIIKLKLRVAVPENYTGSLKASEVNFTVGAIPNETFKAGFTRRSGQIDTNTRTEIWEYEYNNRKGSLKPGMFANVIMKLQRTDSTFTIPFTALVTNLERNFVIRIRDNKTEWIDVKNGMSLPDRIEIFGSLEEGDLVVLKANDEIKPQVSYNVKKVTLFP